MKTSIQRSVAIVTGGGRGLGRAMALGLAENGYAVVITAAREGAELDAVVGAAPEGFVHGELADVADPASAERVVAAALERFGRLDILVNNAGRGMRTVAADFMTTPSLFWEADPTAWRHVVDTNVNGPFFMARAAVPHMLERGFGRIVNITMNHATMRRKGFSPYGPSKAALESETIIWAHDLAGSGITVNALLPGGATATGMIPDAGVPDEVRAKLLDPSIVVPPLLWLVSEEAANVSGRRFDASRWDTRLVGVDAALAAGDTAGWTS
jgi:3-oxoacyl-[acyl-carrier protein] reductase